jgi:hypothetical protein
MKYVSETGDRIFFQLTSKKGKPYQVGYPKEGGLTRESIDSELSKANKSNAIASDWKVLKWDPYNKIYITSTEANDIGIESGGVLFIPNPSIYEFQLYFYNTKGWYFGFEDATGDIYTCATIINGNHWVDYNSADATILATASL